MNKETYTYTIGDIIKTRKMLHLEQFEGKPMVVMGQQKSFGSNEYKVIVCGFEYQYFYFIESDIEGKYE
jgi:hypothetical protein